MRANWTAIILTGGTSRRFGSDKSQARLTKYSLLDEILRSLPIEIPVIVVGPGLTNSVRAVQVTREQPISGGPVRLQETIRAKHRRRRTDPVAV